MTLARQQRRALNARIAWYRAHNTFVYIEGLTGVHPLQTGIVYYWRGHHIYSYPLGNLVEQIPFSTRQGIATQGIVDNAPPYDGSAPDLVDEADVHALAASIFTEQEIQQEQLLQAYLEDISRLIHAVPAVLPYNTSLLMPPTTAAPRPIGTPTRQGTTSTQLSPVAPGFQYTPRFGQDFLAASAPGSRVASPLPSPFRAQQGAISQRLRPSASMQRLTLTSINEHQGPFTHRSVPQTSSPLAMRGSSLLTAGQQRAETARGISGTNNTSSPAGLRDSALCEAGRHNVEAAQQASPASGAGYLHGHREHAVSEADQQCAEAAQDNPFLVQNAPYVERGSEYDGIGAEWDSATEDSYSSGGTAIMSMVESRRRDIADWASAVEERAWDRAGPASL